MARTASKEKSIHEFRVVFQGIKLPAALVDRIGRAVQKAVMNELVDTDMRPAMRLRFSGNGGSTQGMQLVAEDKEAV